MKLAHIAPISLLNSLPANQRTHLVLSTLMLENLTYRRFYQLRKELGDTLILDNPVHENRGVTLEYWCAAVNLTRPSVAVIPDVIDSMDRTLSNVEEGISAISGYEIPDVQLMAVPHGHSQSDWLNCALSIAKYPEISWLGLSLERRLDNDDLALLRRRERVEMLRERPEVFDRLTLHLLGLSEGAIELGEDRVWSRAYSVDTSKFVVWNMTKAPVKPPAPIHEFYPGRYFLGGSYNYFFAPSPEGTTLRKIRNNLTRWCTYADREQD